MSGKQYFQIYGQEPGPLPSSEPLYRDLKILKLEDIFKLNIAIFVFSTLVEESPEIFHDWFSYDHEIHEHSTRAGAVVTRENYFDVGAAAVTYTLHTKGSKNQHGEKMLQKSGPLIWNNIPAHIQGAATTNTFKINLKKYYLAQYDNDNDNNNNDNPYSRIYNTHSNNNIRTNTNTNITFKRPFVSRWDGGTQ